MQRCVARATHENIVSPSAPQWAESFLSQVDAPLRVAKDPVNQVPYLVCDYNRDGDSYRYSSPYTALLPSEYFPTAPLGATLTTQRCQTEVCQVRRCESTRFGQMKSSPSTASCTPQPSPPRATPQYHYLRSAAAAARQQHMRMAGQQVFRDRCIVSLLLGGRRQHFRLCVAD